MRLMRIGVVSTALPPNTPAPIDQIHKKNRQKRKCERPYALPFGRRTGSVRHCNQFLHRDVHAWILPLPTVVQLGVRCIRPPPQQHHHGSPGRKTDGEVDEFKVTEVERHFGAPTFTRAFGHSPNISGAYIASTRLGGRAKSPTLFNRTVYSIFTTPLGRYS